MTHTKESRQLLAKRLLIADDTLKSKEDNHSMLTAFSAFVPFVAYENCRVVAVTAEKKVAIVVIVR